MDVRKDPNGGTRNASEAVTGVDASFYCKKKRSVPSQSMKDAFSLNQNHRLQLLTSHTFIQGQRLPLNFTNFTHSEFPGNFKPKNLDVFYILGRMTERALGRSTSFGADGTKKINQRPREKEPNPNPEAVSSPTVKSKLLVDVRFSCPLLGKGGKQVNGGALVLRP